MEKVDPEIGPSMSVGHDKPSDLSPESSVRKMMAGRIVKNVVALTGNQPGSGRVKPGRSRKLDGHKDKRGSTAHHKRGKAPGAPQGDPSRGKPQPLGDNWVAHTREVGGKPYYMMENTKTGEVDYPVFYRNGGVGYDRPETISPSVRAKVQQLGPPSKRAPKTYGDQRDRDLAGAAPEGREYPPIPRKQDSAMQGGRTQPGGGTKPVRMPKSGPGVPTGYAPATGATEFSQPQPQYRYGRKACPCNEVAKTMKAVTR